MPLLKLLWSSSDSVFAVYVHKAVIVVADCSAQLIMHYHWVHHCNFFSLLLRFLAIPDKMSKFITVITFMNLCSLSVKLNKLSVIALMLHWPSLWLLIALLNIVEIHWIFLHSNDESLFSHSWSCIRSYLLHSLFSLSTINVNEDIYHLLKFFRAVSSDYFIFNIFTQFSIILQY